MKKNSFKSFLSLLVIAAMTVTALAGCAGGGTQTGTSANTTAPSDQTIKWRAQSTEVAGTARYECTQYFCDKIKEATGGKFEIELYAADTLYPTMNTMEAVGQGVTEAGFTSGDYQAGKEPMLKLQAYRPADPWDDFDTANQFFLQNEPLVEEAYKNLGVIYAATVLALPNESFHSNKPINSLADYKGLKVRSSGLGQELYQALGAAVVNMPMGDIYQAMKLNTIDAFEAGGYIDNFQSALQEVVSYNIEPALHCSAAIMVGQLLVNQSAWDSLPEDIKAAIPAVAEDARKHTYDFLTEENQKGKQQFEDAGVENITLPDADISQAKEIAAGTLKAYWGKSDLSDRFLDLYIKFLNDNGYETVAKAVEK